MTSPSDSAGRAGFTLFEALLSLTILSLVLAIGVVAARPPSPTLQAKSEAARLIQDAGQRRAEAIRTGEPIVWRPDVLACEQDIEVLFSFYSDGTAIGPDVCLENTRLTLHPVAGLLQEVDP